MKRLKGLYVITDQSLYPGRSHVDIAKDAIAGGAKIIQLRDKTISDLSFYDIALEIRSITTLNNVMFFINDRVDIAKKVNADGVNIGQSDIPVKEARQILGDNAIIGVSATNLQEAIQAEKDGADYIGYGPVFPTSTKLDAGPVSGIDNLKIVCEGVSIPVVAIGGIGLNNISEINRTGAECAAVISAVVCAPDMAKATASLIKELER